MTRWAGLMVAVIGLAATACMSAAAADYPTKTIRLVVPYPPGGPADLTGRIIAQKLTGALGQNVIVENKPGSAEIAGTMAVALAPHDGYTLFLGSGQMWLNPILRSNPALKIERFAPISVILQQPWVLLSPTSLGVKTIADLASYVKAHPGAVNFASTGVGSNDELIALRVAQLAGVQMTEITYQGSALATEAVMSGEVQFYVDPPILGVPAAATGKVTIIGVTSPVPAPGIPSGQTLMAQGMNLSFETIYGILAPAGTPKPIIDVLNREIVKAVASEDYQSKVGGRGATPVSSTPEEYAAILQKNFKLFGDMVRETGVHVEQ